MSKRGSGKHGAGSGNHLLAFSFDRERLLDSTSAAQHDHHRRHDHHHHHNQHHSTAAGRGDYYHHQSHQHHPPSSSGGSRGGGRGGGHRSLDNRQRSTAGGAQHHHNQYYESMRVDAAQIHRAALIQRFQFVVSRSDLGHPALRESLMAVDSHPPWEIVKFVTLRCPLDDFTCPICLDNPVAPCASVDCGHYYCLRCIYALAIHAWDQQQQQQTASTTPTRGGPASVVAQRQTGQAQSVTTPPPPTPAVVETCGVAGLSEKALGAFVKGGCPICHAPLSLKAIVPVMHVPVADPRPKSTVTFRPVRHTLPLKLEVFGSDACTFARVCVESDASLAWTAQQAIDLAEALDVAHGDIDAAEAALAVCVDTDRRMKEAEEARIKAALQHPGGGGAGGLTIAAALFGAGTSTAATAESPAIREARAVVANARKDAAAVTLAARWMNDLLQASDESAGAPQLTDADLDVFAIYGQPAYVSAAGALTSVVVSSPTSATTGRSLSDFGTSAPKGDGTELQTAASSSRRQNSSAASQFAPPPPPPPDPTAVGYQAADGQPLYLHPLIVRMIVETVSERSSRPTTTAAAASTCGGGTMGTPPPALATGPFAPGGAAGMDGGFDGEAAEATTAQLTSALPQLDLKQLPPVTVTLDEIEPCEQTRQWRTSNKGLWFLPIAGKFGLAFPEHIPNCVSSRTIGRFKPTLDARRKRRSQRLRREDDDAARAAQRDQDRQRRINDADPGRGVLRIPASQYYDAHHEFDGQSPEAALESLLMTDSPSLGFAPPPDPTAGAQGGSGDAPAAPDAKLGIAAPAAWAPKRRNLLAEHDAPSLWDAGAEPAGPGAPTSTASVKAAPADGWGSRPAAGSSSSAVKAVFGAAAATSGGKGSAGAWKR